MSSFRLQSFCAMRSGLIAALALTAALPARARSNDLAGIAHVAFRVDDLQRARDFYKTLGFEQAFEFSDAGKTSVALIKINDRQFIELYPRSDPSQPGGLMHICFEASDIESVHAANLKAGLQPTDVKKARAGNLLSVMHDPEGQLLEYTQYLPGSLHSEGRGQHLGEHRISQRLFEASAGVRDLEAERAFFITKLSFKSDRSGGAELEIPGNSGEKVELQPASAKPRIKFAVENVRHVAHELRARGFKVEKSHGTISITDPDGAVLVFASPRGLSSKP
jgi:catechol 2,3-dioxygenase-like lactoylglutathione lyase family enzyme